MMENIKDFLIVIFIMVVLMAPALFFIALGLFMIIFTLFSGNIA